MSSKKPTLLLLPNLLNEDADPKDWLPLSVERAVKTIDGLIAESEKAARAYLKRFLPHEIFSKMPIRLLNEHTKENEIFELLQPILLGQRWGVMSDCGLPCLADPGARLVYLARERDIEIEAFSGPSSIVLALMLSGFPAQSFSFCGYLEKDAELLLKQLRNLEKRSSNEKMTQIFIETPYRNQKLLNQLLQTLSEDTYLCVAWDLTAATQGVVSWPIRMWKKMTPPNIDKKPAVFLFYKN